MRRKNRADKERATTRHEQRFSITLRFYLIALLLWLPANFAAEVDVKSMFNSIASTGAITTPWGIIYLMDDPPQALIEHEQCHLERLEEIGAMAFYWDYFSGGGCAEEIRCGVNPIYHPMCTHYPLNNLGPSESKVEQNYSFALTTLPWQRQRN